MTIPTTLNSGTASEAKHVLSLVDASGLESSALFSLLAENGFKLGRNFHPVHPTFRGDYGEIGWWSIPGWLLPTFNGQILDCTYWPEKGSAIKLVQDGVSISGASLDRAHLASIKQRKAQNATFVERLSKVERDAIAVLLGFVHPLSELKRDMSLEMMHDDVELGVEVGLALETELDMDEVPLDGMETLNDLLTFVGGMRQ